MIFRTSFDSTPLTFTEVVPQELREQIVAFFARCDERERKFGLLVAMRQELDEICKLLGFADYKRYWASPLWKQIRRRVLERDNRVCFKCQGKANQVHHRRYSLEVLKGDDDILLVTICAGCHGLIHRDHLGDEHAMDEWDAILFDRQMSSYD